jgi:hypothetical protein
MRTHRRFGWLVTALSDRGHMQKDLAKAWGIDDAVVTRFINTGKPDLTPERQIALARMLGLDHNELIARMYEGVAPRAAVKKPGGGNGTAAPTPTPTPTPARGAGDINQTLSDVQRGVKLLKQMMPSAKITFTIDLEVDGDE